MKRNIKSISLIFLLLVLSACPYKEIYKTVDQTNEISGLKISPFKLFFSSHKGIATADVIYKITNLTDSVKQANFAKSSLININDTLKVEKMFAAHYATDIPLQNTFTIRPQKDTLIAFRFKDIKQKFGDTLKVIIGISGVGNTIFIYKRAK